MKFSYPAIVRFSDCGKSGLAREAAIVNFMQDCSAMQSDSLGIGTDRLLAAGRGWFVIAWNIQIYRKMPANQHIRVWTWAVSYTGIYGDRCMQITDEITGEVYAECRALYVFMNLLTMHPTKVEGELGTGYAVSPALQTVTPCSRKLPPVAGGDKAGTFAVRKHDTDAYGHMNNARYVSYADDYLPDGFDTFRLQVEYRLSARLGDTVHVFTKETGAQFEVEMRRDDGQVFARVLYTKKGEENDKTGRDAGTCDL